MASSRDDDAATLQALLAESAARIVEATRENAALAEEHNVAAATFSSRATAEIGRLEAEQQKVVEAEQALHAKLQGMEDDRRQREEQHRARLAAHVTEVEARIATMHSEFAAVVEAKEQRLAGLEITEQAVQTRARELSAAGGSGSGFAELSVGGERFVVSRKNLARHPNSSLSIAVHAHASGGAGAAVDAHDVLIIDGDPSFFKLVCTFLRYQSFPVTPNEQELRCLVAEGKYYALDALVDCCTGLLAAAAPTPANSSATLIVTREKVRDMLHLNFSGLDFSGLDLSSLDFSSCSFYGVPLVGTNMVGARFANAVLEGCDVRRADFTRANLNSATFNGVVNLKDATLDNLRGAAMAGCDLSSVDLSGVDVNGATFNGVLNLKDATLDNLRGAVMAGCDF
eukprot:gene27663-17034_t